MRPSGNINEGAGKGSADRAPRLQPGSYAAWKEPTHVFLQSKGAQNVHRTEMLPDEWVAITTAATQWEQQELKAAIAAMVSKAAGTSASSSSTVASISITATEEKQRALICDLIKRMERVYGLIYAALPQELQAQVAHIPSGLAYGLWSWLEAKYQSTDADNVSTLLAQWNALQQEPGESFDAYRARVNALRVLLKHVDEEPSESVYAYALVGKLQPQYKPIVLALETAGKLKVSKSAVTKSVMVSAPLDWAAITLQINAHERSEQRLEGEGVSAGHAMAASSRSGVSQGGKKLASSSSGGSNSRDDGWRTQGKDRKHTAGAGSGRDLSKIQCFHCEEFGHYANKCTGKARAEGAGESVAKATARRQQQEEEPAASDGDNDGDEDEPAPNMVKMVRTVEKPKRVSWNQIVMTAGTDKKRVLIRPGSPRAEVKVAAMSHDDKVKLRASKEKEHIEEITRKLKQREAAQAKAKSIKYHAEIGPDVDAALAGSAWGVDTMASCSISGNRSMFGPLRTCAAIEVKGMDGGIVQCTQMGTVTIMMATVAGARHRLVIHNVYYHTSFTANLLSWHALKRMKYEFHSANERTYLVTPGGNEVGLHSRGRVTVLGTASAERVYGIGTTTVKRSSVDELVALHKKLGHIGFHALVELVKHGDAVLHLDRIQTTRDDLAAAQERINGCRGCLAGKMRRCSYGHGGINKGKAPGEELHMDTFFVQVGKGNAKRMEYGLTISDSYTKLKWFARLTRKDEAAALIKATIREAETQLGCRVKRIRMDGGGEFINAHLKDWCAEKGVIMQWPPAETPKLNGVAERWGGTLKAMIVATLHSAHLDELFWRLAGNHCTAVWNRTHIVKGHQKTPWELMTQRKPSIEHLGMFGCDAHYHVPKGQRDALDSKAKAGIYCGMDTSRSCSVVCDLRTGKLVYTRDVKLHARHTFARAYTKGAEAVEQVLDLDFSDEQDPEPEDEQQSTPLQGGCNNKSASEPSAAAAAEDQEYTVERIVDSRVFKGKPQYKVRWLGYGPEGDTWQSADSVADNAALDVYETEQRDREAALQLEQKVEQPADESALPANESAPRRVTRSVTARVVPGTESDHAIARAHMVMSAIRAVRGIGHTEAVPAAEAEAIGRGVIAGHPVEPRNCAEADSGPHAQQWAAARQKEHDTCLERKVWRYVPRASIPAGTRVISNKWVHKYKLDDQGNITRFKARLTPRGFQQVYGHNYWETFARTAKYKTLMLFYSLVAKWNYETMQLDVPEAFLNADLSEDVFMEVPEGFREGREHMVCKLLKSLYGIKQGPRNWDELVHGFITDNMRWKATVSDPSFYVKRSRTGRLMMLYRFVDDFSGGHHAADAAEFAEHVTMLEKRFNIKVLPQNSLNLGMRVTRNREAGTIKLDQELYITQALEKYGLSQCRPAASPEAVGAAQGEPDETLDKPTDRQLYMEITGTVMYAAHSARPDIAHAAQYLATHMQAPTERHMVAAKRVLRYLAGTKTVGLVFGAHNGAASKDDGRGHSKQELSVCAYADADWANDKSDRKSITGWVAKLNGDTISWASKKQRVVALSTCEAELYAEAAAMQEVLWLRGMLQELGLTVATGSTVFGDNQSAIAVSKNGVKGERTKHVDVKYHFVTETVAQGSVKLQWVPTADQEADIFTKALAAPVFDKFRKALMSN